MVFLVDPGGSMRSLVRWRRSVGEDGGARFSMCLSLHVWFPTRVDASLVVPWVRFGPVLSLFSLCFFWACKLMPFGLCMSGF